EKAGARDQRGGGVEIAEPGTHELPGGDEIVADPAPDARRAPLAALLPRAPVGTDPVDSRGGIVVGGVRRIGAGFVRQRGVAAFGTIGDGDGGRSHAAAFLWFRWPFGIAASTRQRMSPAVRGAGRSRDDIAGD